MGNIFQVQSQPVKPTKLPDADPVSAAKTVGAQAAATDKLTTSDSSFFPQWVYDGFHSFKKGSSIIFSTLFFKGLFISGSVFINPLSLFSEEGRASVFKQLLEKKPEDAIENISLFQDDIDASDLVDHVSSLLESADSKEKIEFAKGVLLALSKTHPTLCAESFQKLKQDKTANGEVLTLLFDIYSPNISADDRLTDAFELLKYSTWAANPTDAKDELLSKWIASGWFVKELNSLDDDTKLDRILDDVAKYSSFQNLKSLVSQLDFASENNIIDIFSFVIEENVKKTLNTSKDPGSLAVDLNQVEDLPEAFDEVKKQELYRALFKKIKDHGGVDVGLVAKNLLTIQWLVITAEDDDFSTQEIVNKAHYYGLICPESLFISFSMNDAYPNNSLFEIAVTEQDDFCEKLIEKYVDGEVPYDHVVQFVNELELHAPTLAEDTTAGKHDSAIAQTIAYIAENEPMLFFDLGIKALEKDPLSSISAQFKDKALSAVNALEKLEEAFVFNTFETFPYESLSVDISDFIQKVLDSFNLTEAQKGRLAAQFFVLDYFESPRNINMSREAFQECFFTLSEIAPKYLEERFYDFFDKCVPIKKVSNTRIFDWFFKNQTGISGNLSDDFVKFICFDQCGSKLNYVGFKQQKGLEKPYLLLPISDEDKDIDPVASLKAGEDWIKTNLPSLDYAAFDKRFSELVEMYQNRLDKTLSDEAYQAVEQNLKVVVHHLVSFFGSDTKDAQKIADVGEVLESIENLDLPHLMLRNFMQKVVPLAVKTFEKDDSKVAQAAKELKGFNESNKRVLIETVRKAFSSFVHDSLLDVYSKQEQSFKDKYSEDLFYLGMFQTLFPNVSALSSDQEYSELDSEGVEEFLKENDIDALKQSALDSMEFTKIFEKVKMHVEEMHNKDFFDELAEELESEPVTYEVFDNRNPKDIAIKLKRDVLQEMFIEANLIRGVDVKTTIQEFNEKQLDGETAITEYTVVI